MIRLNYGCDKRACYCVLIFVTDIVPSMSTIQLDFEKACLRVNRGLSQAANEKDIVSDTKVQFLKKAIDRF